MDQERKIRCDCGSFLEEKETNLHNIKTKAMICPSCKFTTFTRAQTEEYIRLKRLDKIINKEKKVIKIGNSMGITLPEELKEFGLKIGKKVKISALSSKAIKIEL